MGGINFSKFGKVGAPLARAGAHGLTQGGFSALRGGNFWHGFASGTIGSLSSTSSQGIDSFGAKVAISSTAGGASSAVAGGSFTDGAITGAYVYLFNHHAHQIETNARIKKENRKNGSGALRWQRDTNGGSDDMTFESVPVFDTNVGDLEGGAAFTLPGVGIFVSLEYYKNSPKALNDLLRHEFGHILQANKWGKDFFYGIIVPASLESAMDHSTNHQNTWTEWTANFLSWQYFGRPDNWNTNQYPLSPTVIKRGSLPPLLPSQIYLE